LEGIVREIDSKTASTFLVPKHDSGRVPSISKAFGWYFNGELKAVCTFGKPASPAPCKGVCGEKWADNVYELNRLCRTDDLTNQLSQFVSTCLRLLKELNWIIISYRDTDMHHQGHIYQACNFIYTGCTEEHRDRYTGNKHARHYANYDSMGLKQIRTRKHRYVYFCTKDKRLKKSWQSDLRWGIEPYPKGDNSNYILGEYQKSIVVDKDNNIVSDDILNKFIEANTIKAINDDMKKVELF
jgi:hypothetical protein